MWITDDIRSKNAATKRKISLNRRPNHQPSALATHSRLSSVAPVFFIQASQADATTSSPTTAKRLYAPPRNWAATKHLLKFGADREQKPNDRDYHPQPFRDSNNTAYRRASSSLKGAVNVRLQRPDGVQLGLGIAGSLL
ncbi:unnamed protein product [Anisakis simplex]|uniref:Podospora anserina S mat+ genomic DNA chromosome 7, supercontig 1 n=1 Tax=Anisakis simplex TaxID=6269 RepID=A0A0M3IY68_ANISI|nr:unnamed protein product [Anisakis simplex]